MNLGDEPVRAVEEVRGDLELADRWILSRLSAATADVTRHLEAFRFHEAARRGYHFFWGELADWYLELIKPRMQAGRGSGEPATAAKATLVHVLDGAHAAAAPDHAVHHGARSGSGCLSALEAVA
jgi:valyl-tRNA synthetase